MQLACRLFVCQWVTVLLRNSSAVQFLGRLTLLLIDAIMI
jgi:hypothetical protein